LCIASIIAKIIPADTDMKIMLFPLVVCLLFQEKFPDGSEYTSGYIYNQHLPEGRDIFSCKRVVSGFLEFLIKGIHGNSIYCSY